VPAIAERDIAQKFFSRSRPWGLARLLGLLGTPSLGRGRVAPPPVFRQLQPITL